MLDRGVFASLLVTLGSAAVVSAGVSFSISASNTDPLDNATSPTESLRNLYLWATCIDDGIAAMEAGLSGSLAGPFTPLNGVMNLGSGSDLLLVVPGCPSPFDPWVVGFSSSLAPPCEVGSDPCGSSEALSASYSELDQFEGSLLRTADWSPTGTSLVFNRGDSCLVLEVGETGTTTSTIIEGRVRRAAWAPDGAWLLVSTRTPAEHRQRLSTLTAVRRDGGQSTTMEPSADIGFFVWGGDGNVYVWRSEGELPVEIAPPTEWAIAYEAPERAQPVLVHARTQGLRGTDQYVFWPGDPEERNVHVSRFAADRRNHVVFLDRFPRGGFLVRVYEPAAAGYDLVLDASGDIAVDYRGVDPLEHLMRQSVSADGRYVAAYDPKDDGHEILSSQLYLISPSGEERVLIDGAPMGRSPRLSKSGHLIAFAGLSGDIHVGELRVTRE
jgi:hypothetical protein